jgi:hypothetical protein
MPASITRTRGSSSRLAQSAQNFGGAQRWFNIVASRVQTRHPGFERCQLNPKPIGNYSLWHLCCLNSTSSSNWTVVGLKRARHACRHRLTAGKPCLEIAFEACGGAVSRAGHRRCGTDSGNASAIIASTVAIALVLPIQRDEWVIAFPFRSR